MRLKKSFTEVDYKFVWSCSCISLDINKIFSRIRGLRFHCVAVHQGLCVLCLVPKQLMLGPLVNSAGAEKQHAGSSSAHAHATFMAGLVGTNSSCSSESRRAVRNVRFLQEFGERCVTSTTSG